MNPEDFNLLPSSPASLRHIVGDYLEESGDAIKAGAIRSDIYKLPEYDHCTEYSACDFNYTCGDGYGDGNGTTGFNYTNTSDGLAQITAIGFFEEGYGAGRGNGFSICDRNNTSADGSGTGDARGSIQGDCFCDIPRIGDNEAYDEITDEIHRFTLKKLREDNLKYNARRYREPV